MKAWILGVVALALGTASVGASACPVGPPDRRTPVVQTVDTQASVLFERARELDAAASSHDRSAAALEREAETLAGRARLLRNQLQLVAIVDRPGIAAVAEELSARASSSRAQAAGERTTAAELRAQARAVRDRAVQLVNAGTGGGGGWRGRPVPRVSSGAAETTI